MVNAAASTSERQSRSKVPVETGKMEEAKADEPPIC
jgi:hypothetical protein